MRAVDIIIKKRDNITLSKEEISFFIKGMTNGDVPDYQVSAWAMAVLLSGMSDQETTDLTLAMADSGEVLDLSSIAPIVVDKHSTGGVGDKTTLVVGPIVAACGLPVGKMSGRGLGFSGGTLDKMESIPGYRVDLSKEEFLAQLIKLNFVLTGQSADLAPADGKLYSLRDVTGTIPSLPLIASSIMSKKIASGAHAIVLDVKVGNGAFMKKIEEARQLAEMMVAIGKLSGREVRAVLSDMNQPLGEAVGNAVELKEAVHTLNNNGPSDFLEHCLVIASQMLVLGNKAENLDEARKMAEKKLEDLSALEKFRELVVAQNGDVSFVDDLNKIKSASISRNVLAPQAGYMSKVHAQTIGETAVDLGAGRARKTDSIDASVGILVHRKVGDKVEKGDALFTVLSNDDKKAEDAEASLLTGIAISGEPCQPLPLFYGVIS